MAKVIKAHRGVFLLIAILFGIVVVASCLVDYGKEPPIKGKSSALSYRSDPSGLPVEGLIDDWFYLHQGEDPDDFSRDLVNKLVGHRHALGEIDASTFNLMVAIDSDQVNLDVYPSLSGLDREQRTATVILAVLELSEEFEGDWAEVVRLVYGDAKSVLDVAFSLNETNAFPIPNEEIENLPFLDHGMLYELARAYDHISGCYSSHCRASGDTVIDNPVVQWLVAYRAGTRAKHKLCNQDPREYLWTVETEDELNLLMYLLGDHEPPAAPELDPVPSPTALNPITLTGTAEANSFVDVTGGQDAAASEANESGEFSIDVTLHPNQENVLSATATDRAGNTSDAAGVTVVHDDIPPDVEITSPNDGTLVYIDAVNVTGMASDASIVTVDVNGHPALMDGSEFSLEDLSVSFGINLIEAVSTDAAGNVGRDLVAVYRPVEGEFPPSGFGVVGPEGGNVTADRPGDPFAGASVEVPPGAVDDYVVIIIRGGGGAPQINDFIPVGPIYELYPTGIEFNVPVTLVLPYVESAIPDWSSEDEINVFFVGSASEVWEEKVYSTVLPGQDKVVVDISSFSFVVAGVNLEPVPGEPKQFCAHTGIYEMEDFEFDSEECPFPFNGWEIFEPMSYDYECETSDGLLKLYAYEDNGDAIFYKSEETLATTSKFDLEVRTKVIRNRPSGWMGFTMYIGFGFSDGTKGMIVHSAGDPGNGSIGITLAEGGLLTDPGTVDWFSFNSYRVSMDKTHPNPTNHKVNLYLNGELLFEIDYNLLPDIEFIKDLIEDFPDPPHIYGFGAENDDTEWDYVKYTICGNIDADGDGLPNQIDNCPKVWNPGQEDTDNGGLGDGVGDVCENPPSVSITSPADKTITAEEIITVTGTATDPDGDVEGVTVTVNGMQTIQAGWDGYGFSADVPLELNKANEIEAEAFDKGGNPSPKHKILVYRGEEGELPEVFEVIGIAGGGVSVSDPSSSIFGSSVVVPEYASLDEQTITIKKSLVGHGSPAGRYAVGPQVIFESEEPFSFDVSITIPFSEHILEYLGNSHEDLEVWRYDEIDGWERIRGEYVTSVGFITVGTHSFSPVQVWAKYKDDLVSWIRDFFNKSTLQLHKIARFSG